MTKQTTITELKQQAEQGDANMQYILGFMYRQGNAYHKMMNNLFTGGKNPQTVAMYMHNTN